VNIALARAPIDSDLLSEFVALLDPINALADRALGFVWRLQTEGGNSIAVRGFDDDRIIVNLSVWDSIDHLAVFVYRSAHTEVMRRRREWFDRIGLHLALWWVPVGHLPTVPRPRSGSPICKRMARCLTPSRSSEDPDRCARQASSA
jgi:hypothetical protein